jgi:hypothetical protein
MEGVKGLEGVRADDNAHSQSTLADFGLRPLSMRRETGNFCAFSTRFAFKFAYATSTNPFLEMTTCKCFCTRTPPLPYSFAGCYEVFDSPNGGKGLRATRVIIPRASIIRSKRGRRAHIAADHTSGAAHL